MSDRPYARLYLDLVDDEKFAGIYEDDHHFAAWCRLLMIAEGAWPASAHLPSSRLARPASVKTLADAQLVDARSGDRYRIHGLDKERGERADKARTSVAHRRDRSNNDRATTVERPYNDSPTSRAEPSQDEPSRAAPSSAPDPADVYWTLTGRYPTDKALSWIDRLTAEYGAEPAIRCLAEAHRLDRSGNTLLGRVEDLLRSNARKLDLVARTAEKERLEAKRSEPRQVADPEAIRAELEALMRRPAA